MSYSICVTATAIQDLKEVTDYIDYTLKNPQAADNLLDEFEAKTTKLTTFPTKFQLVDDALLASWGVRYVVVKNYLAFYVIAEKQKKVYIVRFLYQKSDWSSILKTGFTIV